MRKETKHVSLNEILEIRPWNWRGINGKEDSERNEKTRNWYTGDYRNKT